MPSALLRPCAEPRCSELVEAGHCPSHSKAAEQRRGSSTARGYDYRWRKFSEAWRRRFPLCGMRLAGLSPTGDSRCQREERTTAATLVDHIRPLTGPLDTRKFDETNLQSLCDECHNAKRQREGHTA